jgi:adenylate cyclase
MDFNCLDFGSPIDAFSEAVAETDPELLEQALASPAIRGEVWQSPRVAAAKGRLALARGETGDALAHLATAVETFRQEGLLLDAWHAGRALARAEAAAGERDRARDRLETIAKDAQYRGSLLAARLAREQAAALELELAPHDQPIDSPARAAEPEVLGERLVSVLFCDVRGYTELTRTSVPADLTDRIGALQRWAADEIGAHRGVVDKFAGDAVMATFNVAGSSVDHAVQALRTAIAIRDKAALAGLPIGAGLAVGPAVVGRLADGANLSVLGEVTNLAARLQAEAQAGEILLSEEAYRRVRDWLDSEEQRVTRVELELKGIDQRVVAYRVYSGTLTQA